MEAKMSEQMPPSDNRAIPTKPQNRLAVGFVALAALVSMAAVMAVYGYASRRMREATSARLRDIVSEAALQIDGDLHATLTDPAQEDGEAYLEIKRMLQKVRDVGTDLRFVYTLRYVGGSPPPAGDGYMIFVVDAEPAESPDIAHLGEVYSNVDKDLAEQLYALTEPIADKRFYRDEWGTWMSGYAPIYTSDGRRDAIVAIDMSVGAVLAKERKLLILFLGLLVLVIPLMAFLGWWLGRRLASPEVVLAEGVRRVAGRPK
jgi:two-component system, sensor histidine kinase and response regulator